MTYTGSKAQAGRGSSLSIGATPTLIGEITEIPVNRPKWDTDDVTNLESGSDSEFITTIRKSATFTVKGNRVSSDAGQEAVETAYQNGAEVAFVITLPKNASQTTTGDSLSFTALVLSSDFTVSPTKKIEFSIDLQVTGGMPLTAGS
jgi:hypothetical protein